ncbi:MAG: HD domain-containing protein [Candidatus Woesearchaeota archaeon]
MQQIPNKEQCLKIFKRYVLFSSVEYHSVATTSVAMWLANQVKEKIPNINLDIVFATSLFHDLGKGLVIAKLEPEKYGFEPLNSEQFKTWQLLRSFYQPLENLYTDLKNIAPDFKKVVHETDVASLIIGALFPDFLPYLHQIGGTNNPIYLKAGPEIKIMHYADWRVHRFNIVDFKTRLKFLEEVYWKGSKDEWKKREAQELALEKEIFAKLDITPELDLDAINKMKNQLFKEYDFQINRVTAID